VIWPTKVISVAPDAGTTIGALQNSITTNGSAIYELKRGGVYLTNGQFTIPATAGVLIIRAENGTGPRPVIMGGVPAAGYPAGDNVIRVSSEIKFENIYFTGEDMNGTVHKNTIRVNSGTWFEFNGCMFDKDNAASIRNESQNCVYIFNNCTFRNQVDYASLANGRVFDARDAKQKLSLVMKNCTFYNVSQQVIRTSTSSFDSIIFVNNTCFNIMEGLSFGRALKAVCNNNIFYNCGLMGSALKTAGMLAIDSLATTADDTRSFDFRNNLFFTDPQYKTIMVAPAGSTRYLRSTLNSVAKAFLKNKQVIISDTIVDQSITFTNPAPLVKGYVQYLWENKWPTNFTPTENQRIQVMEDPLNFGDVVAPKVQFSFGYAKTSSIYTAGLKGDIMGDKKWFGLVTSIENEPLIKYDKVKAYFDHSTNSFNVVFNDPDVASYKLAIYTIDGRYLSNRLIQNFGQSSSVVKMGELTQGIFIYVIEGNAPGGKKIVSKGKLIL
jgi:hypothetical protein